MTTDQWPEEYDKVEESKASSSKFLKLESGKKVRLRVLGGPMAFQQYFDKANNKGYNLPFGAQLPGYKLRVQYAYEVLVLDGPMTGDHKIWCGGKKVVEGDMAEIKANYGSDKNCDIILSKKGDGLKTDWKATPVPKSELSTEELKPQIKPSEEIKFATKEELDALPPAPVGAAV